LLVLLLLVKLLLLLHRQRYSMNWLHIHWLGDYGSEYWLHSALHWLSGHRLSYW
jgi:hypothetical protein